MKRDVAKYQWDALGKAIAGIKLPQMMTIGTGDGGKAGADALGQLIQTLTVKELNGIATPAPATK